MNILCAVDLNYARPLRVLLYSLYKTQKEKVNIYFINEDFSDSEYADLVSFVEDLGMTITRMRPSEKAKPYFDFFNNHLKENFKRDKLTVSVFYRIYVLPLLPPDMDRILWLDSDTLVVGDLSEMYHLDFGDTLIAAADSKYYLHTVEDEDEGVYFDKINKDYFYFNSTLRFKSDNVQVENNDDLVYINSGVILFNLKGIRESGVYRNMDISYADNGGFDQSIINNMFRNRVHMLDSMVYNYGINTFYTYGSFTNPLPLYFLKKAKIYHYACAVGKPWIGITPQITESEYKQKVWIDLENEMNSRESKGTDKKMTRDEIVESATITENFDENASFDLKVGFACNNDCRHCVVADKRDSGNMTTKQILDIIDNDIIAHHVRNIQITGGEPSIRKDMPEILKYCWEHDIRTIMQTNGTGFANEDFCRRCAPYLEHAHVAIHSCYPEIHDNIVRHPGGMWKRTIDGFKNLQKYGVHLSTQTVLSKYNIESLYDTFKFIQEMAPGIRMSATYPHMMGNAYSNRFDVAFRYSDHKEVIQKTISTFKNYIFTESIPPCYLYPYIDDFPTIEKDLLESGDTRIGVDFSNGMNVKNYRILDLMDRRKGPKCRECILNKRCVGVWKEYIEVFHDNLDLYPIKG